MKKSERDAQRSEALKWLRSMVPQDSTVYTVLMDVSRSGMSRTIKVVIPTSALPAENNTAPEIIDISTMVGRVLGYRLDKRERGLVVGGCGMDMGFHVVYSLSRALWPEGHICSGDYCRSNDHSNGDRDRSPHKHSDGGYCLRSHWI